MTQLRLVVLCLFLALIFTGCSSKIETPSEECFCISVYDPVCGDGKTYSNSCRAECDGITKYTKGACSKEEQIPRTSLHTQEEEIYTIPLEDFLN